MNEILFVYLHRYLVNKDLFFHIESIEIHYNVMDTNLSDFTDKVVQRFGLKARYWIVLNKRYRTLFYMINLHIEFKLFLPRWDKQR